MNMISVLFILAINHYTGVTTWACELMKGLDQFNIDVVFISDNPYLISKKEYVKDNTVAVENDKLAYIQVMYDRNPMIYVTTPKMFCPFGLNKKNNTLNLQFSNYKIDEHMNSFFEFIKNIEF